MEAIILFGSLLSISCHSYCRASEAQKQHSYFLGKTVSSDYDAEKIHSNNLYQLFSYLLNQEGDDITKRATGILLYRITDKEYDLEYSIVLIPLK